MNHPARRAFHALCTRTANAALDDLSKALQSARDRVNNTATIRQLDLRDATEATINALQSLESTRRFLSNPIARGEQIDDRCYDQGEELALSPFTPPASTPRASIGDHCA